MKCPKCSEENDDNSQFCSNCGGKLNQTDTIKSETNKNSTINKNTLIICITIIICIAIVATAFVLINNNDTNDTPINNNTSSQNQTIDTNKTEKLNKTKKISETDSSDDDSSNARLGSRENPKTTADYNNGHDGEPNPNYGDYYYINGGLYRDDNEYLGGAGTYTFISGNNPYE